MANVCIHEVSTTSKIKILGHIFNGLSEIKKAVEIFCRIGGKAWDTEPQSPISGIHVTCIYESYPCFDSEDYASEDRDFSNYFFSTKPFTKEKIMQLSKLPGRCNAQIIDEKMCEWAVPAVYYGGEGDKMIVATLK